MHPLLQRAAAVLHKRAVADLSRIVPEDAVVFGERAPQLRAEVQAAVDDANALVSRSEQVRRFELVTADAEDREVVTPTLKIRRRELLHRESAVIDALYR